MEYLDYYDEDGNYLGYKSRDEVHKEGLWHNTVHCWLYEMDGSVYFQIRSSSHKFYTTASGHVLKDESIKDAFDLHIKLCKDGGTLSLKEIIKKYNLDNPFEKDALKNMCNIIKEKIKILSLRRK